MARVIAPVAAAAAVLLTFAPADVTSRRARRSLCDRVARALAAADVDVDARQAVVAWAAGVAVTTLVAGLVLGPLPGGFAFICVAVAPAAWLHANRDRAQRHADLALPALLEAAAASVRAGDSLRTALLAAATATSGHAADDLRDELLLSDRRTAVAVARWEQRWPTANFGLAAAAVSVAIEVGGAAARSLDAVAATIRDRHAIAHDVRVLSTQARVSAFVLGVAPVAFGALAGAIDPSTATFLLASTPGHLCRVVGLALDGIGLLWMQRLTAAVQR
jgi:tight adherence protein B